MASEAVQSYVDYLQAIGWKINDSTYKTLENIVDGTDWDEPSSGVDLNNVGVTALIETLNAEDESIKELLLGTAEEAFSAGESEYLLCRVHNLMLKVLTGNFSQAYQEALPLLLQLQMALEFDNDRVPLGLIYFPVEWYFRPIDRALVMETLYQLPRNGIDQAYQYLNQVFVRSAQIFYNATGQRALSFSSQINPHLPIVQLKRGIATRMGQQFEGFVNLHNARRLVPDDLTVLQSLALAYRDIGEKNAIADCWDFGRQLQQNSQYIAGKWTELEPDGSFTYVPFDRGVTLAVEPSFKSLVTSVLLAEGDWFETEMQFWRNLLKSGMTVIDVGANAGVYTFSAATRVGNSGKVIAIEPFPACVGYLQETCRVNQFDWVRVYGAAASDRSGNIRLSIQGSSELNEVIADDAQATPGKYVEVPCLTLDSLIDREDLKSVDLLKLDAEGHEINVLQGSSRLLKEFAPIILYENIAGAQGSNVEVANFLIQQGYQLNVYQPYLDRLVELSALDELGGRLNIVAKPNF